jgi:photosystem II stability/assembly factor-like uncharacterized protein
MRAFCVSIFFAAAAVAQTYTVQNSSTAENLRGVSAPSAKVIWASGTHGTFLRSSDGGTSWHEAKVPGAADLDFRDVEAFDDKMAYLLSAGPGEKSRIYKTTDGGKSWELQFTNKEPKGFFDCMAFWDRERGIAVGDPVDGKFELITTDDGGKNWKAIPPDSLPPAHEGEGAFAASGTCIAVNGKSDIWFATGGPVARVFHSSDSGKNWIVADTPIVHGADSTGIFSIAFRDAQHGVIAGGDYKQPGKSGPNLAFTDDGGATWKLAAVSPQWYFSVATFDREAGGVFVAGSSRAAVLADPHAKSWRGTWDLSLNAATYCSATRIMAVGPQRLTAIFALSEQESGPK